MNQPRGAWFAQKRLRASSERRREGRERERETACVAARHGCVTRAQRWPALAHGRLALAGRAHDDSHEGAVHARPGPRRRCTQHPRRCARTAYPLCAARTPSPTPDLSCAGPWWSLSANGAATGSPHEPKPPLPSVPPAEKKAIAVRVATGCETELGSSPRALRSVLIHQRRQVSPRPHLGYK